VTTIESTIGGLTFSIEPTNANGIAELEGWYSAAPKRVIAENRPNSDGAFDVVKDYRGARVITQRGLMSAVSVDDAITNAWRAFAGLQAAGAPSAYSVTDAAGTLSCNVSVVVADITPIVDGDAEYLLQLVARDPIKYGPSTTYTTGLPTSGGGLEFELFEPSGALDFGANGNLGRVDVTNAGTADVWPIFMVTGALTTGFFIQELASGSILRYDRVVPAGSSVSLNSRTGEVLVDGISDGSTYLTSAQWFSVPAGGSVTVQFNAIGGSTGAPEMTVTSPDGFW
jgi:hypothetical protein